MALVIGLFVLGASSIAARQEPTPAIPAVFSDLEGSWEGTGTLLGQPGVFRLTWESRSDNLVHLSFSNGWAREGGEVTPLISARATYLVEGQSATGVWLDDRPQRLVLDAAITDSTVVTHWSSESERGRTEYRVRSPSALVVLDFVWVDGVAQPFGEATYRRARRP